MKTTWPRRYRTVIRILPYAIAVQLGIIVIATLEDEQTRQLAGDFIAHLFAGTHGGAPGSASRWGGSALILGTILIGALAIIRWRAGGTARARHEGGRRPFSVPSSDRHRPVGAPRRTAEAGGKWGAPRASGQRTQPDAFPRRGIDPADIQALIMALSKTPSDLNLEVANDPEAGYLALQLADIFSKSGWEINPSYLDVPARAIGCTIISRNDNPANLAVIHAFRQIGIEYAIDTMPDYRACVGVPNRNLPVTVLISPRPHVAHRRVF